MKIIPKINEQLHASLRTAALTMETQMSGLNVSLDLILFHLLSSSNHFPAYCACLSVGSGQEVWQPHWPPSHAACEFRPCVNAAGSQPSARMQQINNPEQTKQREQILERVTRHPAKSYNYPKEKRWQNGVFVIIL